MQRASPLGKQLRTTPRGAGGNLRSPRNQQHHHNFPSPRYSSPAKRQQYGGSPTKRGASGSSSSSNRSGTFFVLIACFMPLILMWQWWIFWFNQNHLLQHENRYNHNQQPPQEPGKRANSLSILSNTKSSMGIQSKTSASKPRATSTTTATAAAVSGKIKTRSVSTNDAHDSTSSTSWTTTTAATSKSTTSSKEEQRRLLKEYDYAHAPILPKDVYQPQSSNPLNVFFVDRNSIVSPSSAALSLPLSSSLNHTTLHQTKSLLLEGLERSRYIHVTTTGQEEKSLSSSASNRSVRVHLIDWASLQRDCHLLERYYYYQQQQQRLTSFPLDAVHYLVYYDTSDSARVVTCPRVNALFATEDNVRTVKQAIVVNRHWDAQLQWIAPGRIAENTIPLSSSSLSVRPILHASTFLRESFVDLLSLVLEKEEGIDTRSSGNWTNVPSLLAKRKRKLDVAMHMRKGDYARYSFLRRRVGQEVVALGSSTTNRNITTTGSRQQSTRSLRTLVRIMGDENEISNGQPQVEYVMSLLTTKIIIVAQHDEWEGNHERLLQAMSSGALVFTDTMLAPPHGIKNGTNVVTYDSAESLERLVWHYLHPHQTKERLAIAKRGCQLALDKHRSWHRMEQVLFGSTKSKVASKLLLPLSSPTTKRRRQAT